MTSDVKRVSLRVEKELFELKCLGKITNVVIKGYMHHSCVFCLPYSR